jgi:hypothetical protein
MMDTERNVPHEINENIRKKAHKMREYKNYGIIAAASLFAVFFLPMIGSVGIPGWNLPVTVVGWVVWIITKLLVAGLNMILFRSFMEQGEVNVKDNHYYIEANEILMRYGKILPYDPRDPATWKHIEYKNKGIMVIITSLLGAIGLTQAILTFNWLDMLSYMFTVAMGIMFGLLQMDKAETYWTTEYWQYAKKVERDMLKIKGDVFYAKYDCPVCGRGAHILGANNNTSDNSPLPTNDVATGSSDIRSVGDSTSRNPDTTHNNSANQKTL